MGQIYNEINNLSAKLQDGDGVNLTSSLVSGKQALDVNVTKITTVPSDSSLIQLLYDKTNSSGAVSTQWQDAIIFTVPSGYNFNISSLTGNTSQLQNAVRAINRNILGTFNTATNVFTPGISYSSPKFASQIYAYVSTALSATATTLTITYINNLNITKTTTVTIPSASIVGTRIPILLNNGDYGVTQITNITDSANPTGVIRIEGVIDLLYIRLTSTNTDYTVTASSGSLVIKQNEIVVIQYLINAVTASTRRIFVLGTLEESTI